MFKNVGISGLEVAVSRTTTSFEGENMKLGLKIAAAALALVAGHAVAGRILLTQFDYASGPSGDYQAMEANLEAAGHTVDIIDARISGNVASAIGTGVYSQVFLWDLTATAYLSAADVTSLTTFYNNHKSVVVDTRSYGYYFQPYNTSEVALIRNVAAQFDLRGGGVWVGTDHDPDWTRNGNQFLAAAGFNTITGVYSDPVNLNDPASVLLSGVTTTSLWGGGASIGRAPLGIQPNGADMRFHFGHDAPNYVIPYITASFGNFITPNEDPDDHGAVPEPGTLGLLGLGVIAMGFVARRKKA